MSIIFIFFSILTTSTLAQVVNPFPPKEVMFYANEYTLPQLDDINLHVKPILPKILKNHDLSKEYICLKVTKEIRTKKGKFKLDDKNTFLYAKFTRAQNNPKGNQTIQKVYNKKLYFNKEKNCHYLGFYENHELNRLNGKLYDFGQIKDLEIYLYDQKTNYSVLMGKDPSLVKACKLIEPEQKSNTEYNYNLLTLLTQKKYNNCMGRFSCHLAHTQNNLPQVVASNKDLSFEFSGHCISNKVGIWTCPKISPTLCANSYLKALINQETTVYIEGTIKKISNCCYFIKTKNDNLLKIKRSKKISYRPGELVKIPLSLTKLKDKETKNFIKGKIKLTRSY